MILGIIFAAIFCKVMYNGQGEAPRVVINCGPFVNGHFTLCGYHIHHWMVFWCAGIAAIRLEMGENIIAFCAYLVLHGLSYPDRFKFTCVSS